MKIDYSDISRTYDRYRSYPEALTSDMIKFGGIKAGTRLLDLGCGTGNVASGLIKLIGLQTVGLDKSMPMLEIAGRKGLEVMCADVEQGLPFRDRSFDAVVAAYVIQHVRNAVALLSECYRVIKDGSLVLLTSSHKQIENQHPVIKEFFPGCIPIEKARFPDIPGLECMLKEAGFEDIRQEEVQVAGIPIDRRYLEQVQNKFVSTYHMLPEQEFERGVRRLEEFIEGRKETEYREWRGTLVRGSSKR